ncbi:DUF4019 domain-containing protein [Burkholderia pseudomallei]|nr:DUF4019 domain-containing protein [Burkholderia pseudomallei]
MRPRSLTRRRAHPPTRCCEAPKTCGGGSTKAVSTTRGTTAPPASGAVHRAALRRRTRRLRAPLGALARRVGSDIMLSRFTHATDLSDGLYANVDCTTARQRGNVVLEKRSLRQESDGRRRLVSYAPRRRRGVAPSLAGQ